MKLIIYHTNPLQFGGIDTFDYNFCKKLRDKFDITFLYKQGNLETIDRLKNLEIEVEKYDEDKKYICDICLCASAWGGYPDTVIAKTGRYIQMVHADYIRAKEVDFEYKKWVKTTEHVGVGQHVCDVFKELYPNEKITKIYNLLDDKQDTKPILKLVSATRVSKEKGYDRMIKLAQSLKQAGIKFRWTIFTNLELYDQKPLNMDEVVYMKPSHDLFDYIAEADYGVQLSDTEGYCYFVNECLQYDTPVISTDYPSALESIKNGYNGYLLDMELSNLDINKIVNNIPSKFKYEEKGKVSDWIKLLNKKVDKPVKKYKVVANQDYTDKRPELIIDGYFRIDWKGNAEIKKDDIYYLESDKRAKEIKDSGLAQVTKLRSKNGSSRSNKRSNSAAK